MSQQQHELVIAGENVLQGFIYESPIVEPQNILSSQEIDSWRLERLVGALNLASLPNPDESREKIEMRTNKMLGNLIQEGKHLIEKDVMECLIGAVKIELRTVGDVEDMIRGEIEYEELRPVDMIAFILKAFESMCETIPMGVDDYTDKVSRQEDAQKLFLERIFRTEIMEQVFRMMELEEIADEEWGKEMDALAPYIICLMVFNSKCKGNRIPSYTFGDDADRAGTLYLVPDSMIEDEDLVRHRCPNLCNLELVMREEHAEILQDYILSKVGPWTAFLSSDAMEAFCDENPELFMEWAINMKNQISQASFQADLNSARSNAMKSFINI